MLDLASYDAYLRGDLTNYELPQDQIDQALMMCPTIEG